MNQQDCEKTTGPFFMKLGGRIQHGQRKDPFNFVVDPSLRASYFSLSLKLGDRAFVLHFLHKLVQKKSLECRKLSV